MASILLDGSVILHIEIESYEIINTASNLKAAFEKNDTIAQVIKKILEKQRINIIDDGATPQGSRDYKQKQFSLYKVQQDAKILLEKEETVAETLKSEVFPKC